MFFMKKISLILLFQFLLFNLFAQTKVESLSTLSELTKDSSIYEGHSLSKLLNNIGPKILSVTGVPSYNHDDEVNFFIFYFVDRNTYRKKISEKKEPIRIRVYVKEKLDWDVRERGKKLNEPYWLWTEGDLNKYGNLTVLKFKVYGDDF